MIVDEIKIQRLWKIGICRQISDHENKFIRKFQDKILNGEATQMSGVLIWKFIQRSLV